MPTPPNASLGVSPTRRALPCALLGASLGLWADSPAQASPGAMFRIPGEFEPTQSLWLSYDPGYAAFTVALIKALASHVKLTMINASADKEQAARELLRSHAIKPESLRWFIDPNCIFFLRDAAAFARAASGALGVVDFRWSHYGLAGWCANRHAGDAGAIAQCSGPTRGATNALDLALARFTRAKVLPSAVSLEGGALEVNGQGLMIANQALVRQRNPSLNLGNLEQRLKQLPGVKQIIWLPEGLAEDPHLRASITGPYVGWGTGGHTDEFVRFADPQTVLLAWPDDALALRHPVAGLNRQRMKACEQILLKARDLAGRPLNVVRVPTPAPIERPVVLTEHADPLWSDQWTARFFPPSQGRREGDRLIQVATASYMNFIIANGAVVVPDYEAHGTPRSVQRRVARVLESAFPGREIVFIDALALNWFGGGPHCATLKQPA